MNKRTLNIIIGVILIVGIGGAVLAEKNEALEGGDGQVVDQPNVTDSTKSITVAEVATHKDATSCWATINEYVYDLTSWIPHHPGGQQAILQLCGTDGSAKFNRQHGQSNKVLTVLSGFKIGVASN